MTAEQLLTLCEFCHKDRDNHALDGKCLFLSTVFKPPLVGRTIQDVIGGTVGSDQITFAFTDGSSFGLLHHQDCCESVSIEEIVGDLGDLIGVPLTMAEEVSSPEEEAALDAAHTYAESHTWTFYKFATNKGYVTLRWLGTSNGYYSEGVSATCNGPLLALTEYHRGPVIRV